ncbi:MAG: divalent-cation tolerance protein CutA [Campylobacterales bacterium]
MSIEISCVMTTVPSLDEARTLARGAVDAGLAACAQVGSPLTSFYYWEGNLEEAQEWPILFKCSHDMREELETFIANHHSYTIPEIVSWPLAAFDAYGGWVVNATQFFTRSQS